MADAICMKNLKQHPPLYQLMRLLIVDAHEQRDAAVADVVTAY